MKQHKQKEGTRMRINLQGSRFLAGHTNNVLKNIMTGQLQQNRQQEQNDNNKILAMLDVTSSMSCNMPKKTHYLPALIKYGYYRRDDFLIILPRLMLNLAEHMNIPRKMPITD